MPQKVTITIPSADKRVEEVKSICDHFLCSVKYGDRSKSSFEITGDPLDIFWLGMNWNNGLINTLIRQKNDLEWQLAAITTDSK